MLVRTRSGLSRHVHANHPFDVLGWDGCNYPFALSIHDFEPIVGRVHQPPPVHQTFTGPGLVICSFVPRLYDFDPDAVKVPYHHSNVDSDEVLFYSGGDFMSRAGSGIGKGSISLHPSGFVHGPQPGCRERSEGKDRTEELAVMMDTFKPLGLTDAARDRSATRRTPGLGRAMPDTWAPVPEGSDFPLENLPFGIVRIAGSEPRVVTRVGDHVLDLAAAGIVPELTARPSLNALMASGRGGEVRAEATDMLVGRPRDDVLTLVEECDVLLPFEVADYVDSYSSIHHATNLGQILRSGQRAADAELAAHPGRVPRARGLGGRVRHTGAAADRDGGVG